MALVRDNALVADEYFSVADGAEIPPTGPVLVSFEQWQSHRERLLKRGEAVGVRLHSDQSPELIAEELSHLALVALEFPKFRDGRAYSYARILRERYGFRGELRAVGDVLMEQLHFMVRTGFNAFEIAGPDPLGQLKIALGDFSVWYQPTGDGRKTAVDLRHVRKPSAERK
jgi:uncharacterized protein (DUF934 family)